MYEVGLWNSDLTPEAEAHNKKWLGPTTLGIEITKLSIARRCGYGNIDPQHKLDGNSSAVEASLTIPLPPDGAKLLTARPDADALAAMAVLIIRLDGDEVLIDRELIRWIGAVDREGFALARHLYPALYARFGRSKEVNAINVLAYQRRHDPLAKRVSEIAMILVGEMSSKRIQTLAAEKRVATHPDFNSLVERYEDLAVIEAAGGYHEARRWGGSRFPIVLVYDPKIRRFTLLTRSTSFNMRLFLQTINELEARERRISVEKLHDDGLEWGGTPHLISSCTGRGRKSVLSKQSVIQAAHKCICFQGSHTYV